MNNEVILRPEFNGDNDKIIAIMMLFLSIFLSWIPSILIILFAKPYISENTYNISKSVFNFELILFIISLITIIPIVGWILGILLLPVLMLLNTIVMLLALFAIAKNRQIKIPVMYEIL